MQLHQSIKAGNLNGVSVKVSSNQTAAIGGLSDIDGNPITGTSTLHRNKK